MTEDIRQPDQQVDADTWRQNQLQELDRLIRFSEWIAEQHPNETTYRGVGVFVGAFWNYLPDNVRSLKFSDDSIVARNPISIKPIPEEKREDWTIEQVREFRLSLVKPQDQEK